MATWADFSLTVTIKIGIVAKMTRQRKWQIEKQLSGNCVICGKKRDPESSHYCELHRKTTGIKARNRYRVAHWIPINIKRDLRRKKGVK